jgi:hypothetical protein
MFLRTNFAKNSKGGCGMDLFCLFFCRKGRVEGRGVANGMPSTEKLVELEKAAFSK